MTKFYLHCCRIEKQTIIELPAEIVSPEHAQNDVETMDEIIKNFILSEQNDKNQSKEIPSNTGPASDVSVTDIVVTSLSDMGDASSREGNIELKSYQKPINFRKQIASEHLILVSPLLNRLLNRQALPDPQRTNIFNPNIRNIYVNDMQNQLKRLGMDNTVYNIHHLIRNRLSQVNNANSNKNRVENTNVGIKQRTKLPLLYYTPFINDEQVLDVPSDFASIASFDPNDCCGENPSKQINIFDRINRGMKLNQSEVMNVNSRKMKQIISGTRTNDKFNSDLDDADETDSDIIMENISLNGPAANYRADGHIQQGFKYNEFPELRIGNPFERTTTVPSMLTNDGIYINKLKIRKGGIAIAGPNGVATAGSGGTAIVGPGGVAYTKPNGLAVAGPGARVISVPRSTNLQEFLSNMQTFAQGRSSLDNFPIPEGARIVAFGPIIYYNKDDNI